MAAHSTEHIECSFLQNVCKNRFNSMGIYILVHLGHQSLQTYHQVVTSGTKNKQTNTHVTLPLVITTSLIIRMKLNGTFSSHS